MAAHADADDRDLDHIGIRLEFLELQFVLALLKDLDRAIKIAARHREGHVGAGAVLGHVLHDHIDIDVGVCERAEDGRGDTRPVRNADQRDLGFIAAVGDAADNFMFHDIFLVNDQGSRQIAADGVIERREYLHRHPVVHGQFDRTCLEHLGTEGCHFKHLLIGDLIQLAGPRHDTRVRGIDPVHVGVDVAAVGLERRGQRHRRRVRAATAQRGDPVVRPDTLEARQHADLLVG